MEWDLISNWLQASTNEAILDVGCADGFYTRKLARRRCNALGIELDKDAVRLACRHESTRGIEFLIGDAQKLPIKGESLDKIILVSVLEHIPNDDYTLKEIARVLKAGGCLVMSLDSLSHKTTSDLMRERHRKRHRVKTFYTIPSIRKKLKRNGLHLERGQYILSSRLSNMFLKLRHAHITFPIAYPLSKVSDRFSSGEEGGAMLVVKARKNKCNCHKRANILHSTID
ncbi:MAG: class I SAM-dependent methyltransferase [Candidatus Bathyarchaeota archaeon]|nr:MAG: class I SAM-dependent methyltransferase [Candidatus Bathyarchaeota archaeon]